MIADAAAAFAEIFTPPFRAALLKVLALTLLVLVLAAAVLHHALLALVTVHSLWLATTISIVTGLGLALGSVFLVAPVSALVAGFFIDDLAARVEQDIDPAAPPGRPLAVWTALVLSGRFALLSLAVTLMALVLLLVPGVNAVAFLCANAYLLSRQYFEFVALRHLRLEDAAALRRRHAGRLWAAGFVLAAFVAVPVLNLLTPLFGAAFMVRVFKRLLPASDGSPARSR